MASDERPLPLTREVPSPHIGPYPPRVLVVEASEPQRSAVVRALQRVGCHPIEASCAEEGWIAAMAYTIDLAMVSESLRDMSGAALVRLLRTSDEQRLRQLPIVGLTDHAGGEQSLSSSGVTCFVRSPYHETDVMQAILWVAEVYWADLECVANGLGE